MLNRDFWDRSGVLYDISSEIFFLFWSGNLFSKTALQEFNFEARWSMRQAQQFLTRRRSKYIQQIVFWRDSKNNKLFLRHSRNNNCFWRFSRFVKQKFSKTYESDCKNDMLREGSRYQIGWKGKVPKEGGVILNPKNYVDNFGPF